MTFFNEELTLFTPTSANGKIDEIEKNPNVHILIGYENEGLGIHTRNLRPRKLTITGTEG
jgi:general stress protein 26